MKTLSCALALLAVSCANPKPPELPPSNQPPSAGGAVELGDSFLIPEAKISHTPSVVFTSDGKHMVTATSDGEIVVFDVATRKLVRRIRFPEEGTDGVSMDASGRYAVWALKKGGVAVMEIASGKITARDVSISVKHLALAPDGATVAVARGKELELREVPGLSLVRTVPGHAADITNLAWSADGKFLGSTAMDGRLVIYDVAAKRAVYETKKAMPLYAVAFHPKGGFVAYGGQDQKVYQYEFATEREEVISKDQPYWITCLGYSPDGEMIAVGDESCDIWLYRVKKKELAFHNKHHLECWLNSVAWAPDHETFLFGCRPNSHAGKPTVMHTITVAEASRSSEVRRRRGELDRALEREIAKTKDEKERKTLEDYRKALAGEAPLQNQGGLSLTDIDGYTLMSGSTFSIAPDPINLPSRLQKLAQDHRDALDTEMKRLQSNYCVNQWKVKR